MSGKFEIAWKVRESLGTLELVGQNLDSTKNVVYCAVEKQDR